MIMFDLLYNCDDCQRWKRANYRLINMQIGDDYYGVVKMAKRAALDLTGTQSGLKNKK